MYPLLSEHSSSIRMSCYQVYVLLEYLNNHNGMYLVYISKLCTFQSYELPLVPGGLH